VDLISQHLEKDRFF